MFVLAGGNIFLYPHTQIDVWCCAPSLHQYCYMRQLCDAQYTIGANFCIVQPLRFRVLGVRLYAFFPPLLRFQENFPKPKLHGKRIVSTFYACVYMQVGFSLNLFLFLCIATKTPECCYESRKDTGSFERSYDCRGAHL